MKGLDTLITDVTELEGITPEFMVKRQTMRAVHAKHVISWIALHLLECKPSVIASKLGYSNNRNIVSCACRVINEDICSLQPYTLYILTEILCKQEKTTREKTDGTCSPSTLYNMLLRYLPSELRNTLQTRGKISPTATTATKQHSSDTSSNTNKEKSTTTKADSHTSHTSHGTPSFSYTSDIYWAKEQSQTYDFATTTEQQQIYSALRTACEWGRKCAYENLKRMEQLHDNPHILFIPTPD